MKLLVVFAFVTFLSSSTLAEKITEEESNDFCKDFLKMHKEEDTDVVMISESNEVSENLKPLDSSKNLLKSQVSSRNLHKPPESSRHLQKHQDSSRFIQIHSDSSRNLY